jgi:integrase
VNAVRLAINPFGRMPRGNEHAGRKRPRRALNEADLVRLLDAARHRPLAEYGRKTVKVAPAEGEQPKRSNWTYEPLERDGIPEAEAAARKRLADRPELIAKLEAAGRVRALTYKALVLTGLRLNELRSLTLGQVDLGGTEPYATLKAADEKARRGAEILLRGDLAKDLSQHLAERLSDVQRAAAREGRPIPVRLPADTPLLELPPDPVHILDRDLLAAGIARRVKGAKSGWRIDKADERGRTFDMHAFRTTFNSLLAAAGVPLTTRRILMRHAAKGITDEHYTDAKLIDLRGALDLLPRLPLDAGRPEAERQAATGTDGAAPVYPSVYSTADKSSASRATADATPSEQK